MKRLTSIRFGTPIFLIFLSTLGVITLLVNQWSVERARHDALVVNFAGRERMLVLKSLMQASKSLLEVPSQEMHYQLHLALQEFEDGLHILEEGGTMSLDGQTTSLPPATGVFHEALDRAEESMLLFHARADDLLAAQPGSSETSEALQDLENLAEVTITSLDQAVSVYQQDAEERVEDWSFSILVVTVIGLTLLVAVYMLAHVRLLRPLVALHEASGRMEQNLDTPVSVPVQNEIGDVALAMEKMRVALRERMHQMESLLDLSRRLSVLTNTDAIADTTAERLQEYLDADYVALMLHQPSSNELVAAGQRRPGLQPENSAEGFGLSPGHPFRCPPDSCPVMNPGAPSPCQWATGQLGVQSALALPVKVADRLSGSLCIWSLQPEQEFHTSREFLEMCVAEVNGALSRVRERETLVEMEALSEASRLKQLFISTVSHDLRAPLTGILGFSDLMLSRSTALPATQLEWLGTIRQEAQRLDAMVDDLLAVSRLGASQLEVSIEGLELEPVLREALQVLGVTTDKHQFVREFTSDLPRVRADRGRLVQVLRNLLTNAVKYSPSGGSVTVTAWYEPESRRVVVGIKDEGMGIAPENMEKLFNTFSRIRRSETEGIAGTGLGLHIVKMLVELMGGEVWVESELNRGSTFSFSLPVEARQ